MRNHYLAIGGFLLLVILGNSTGAKAVDVAVPRINFYPLSIPVPQASFTMVSLPQELQVTVNTALKTIIPKHVRTSDRLAQKLGFTSASEVKGILEGEPLPIFSAGLGPLRNLKLLPNQEITEISSFLRSPVNFIGSVPVRLFYPIYPLNAVGQRGEIRSSVLVNFSQDKNRWRVTGLGFSNLIKKVIENKSSDTAFVLWVPAFNRYYLGEFQGVAPFIEFTVLFEDPPFNHNSGQKISAKKLFALLKAKAHSSGDGTDPG